MSPSALEGSSALSVGEDAGEWAGYSHLGTMLVLAREHGDRVSIGAGEKGFPLDELVEGSASVLLRCGGSARAFARIASPSDRKRSACAREISRFVKNVRSRRGGEASARSATRRSFNWSSAAEAYALILGPDQQNRGGRRRSCRSGRSLRGVQHRWWSDRQRPAP